MEASDSRSRRAQPRSRSGRSSPRARPHRARVSPPGVVSGRGAHRRAGTRRGARGARGAGGGGGARGRGGGGGPARRGGGGGGAPGGGGGGDARARIRGDGEHDDGGGVQWHDGGRQLSIRARRAAGRRAPGRLSRAARLAAAISHGGAAGDARDPRDDAGGRPVPDPSGHDPLARRAAAAARGWRAARAGCARMQRPRGAGTPHGAGGTVTGDRIGGRNPVCRLVAIFLLPAGAPVRLSAQVPDTTPPPLVTTGALVVGTDTTHRIRPIGAFLRSLLVPGWGQAATGRHVTGAVFATWEGVAAMMTLKAQSEMHYLKDTHSANLTAKRQEVQDWIVLWVFNHLFSGAEAFVSAHLQDFPKDLKIRTFPGGIGISVPVPRP